MIRLSGMEPGKDIEIIETGIRPGEKLYEELLMDEEGLSKTENEMIYIGHPISMDDDKFREQLAMLKEASYRNADNIEDLVAEVVPTYHRLQKQTSDS